MINTVQEQPRIPGHATPRWVAPLLIIQSLTLVLAFASNGIDVPVAAAQEREENQDRGNVLPNAAEQRQEQIRLLRTIAAEMGKANGSLEKINKHAEEAANQNRPAGN